MQKEEDARRAKREATEKAKREEEARTAESLLPDSEVTISISYPCQSYVIQAMSARAARIRTRRRRRSDDKRATQRTGRGTLRSICTI